MLAVTQKHCVMCHARNADASEASTAAAQVVLETIEDLPRLGRPKYCEQVVWDRNMPLGNENDMTDEERALLAAGSRARLK